MKEKYQAIICTHCKVEHFDVLECKTGRVIEDTHADEHGAWKTGFGDTVAEAKAAAVDVWMLYLVAD